MPPPICTRTPLSPASLLLNSTRQRPQAIRCCRNSLCHTTPLKSPNVHSTTPRAPRDTSRHFEAPQVRAHRNLATQVAPRDTRRDEDDIETGRAHRRGPPAMCPIPSSLAASVPLRNPLPAGGAHGGRGETRGNSWTDFVRAAERPHNLTCTTYTAPSHRCCNT